MPIYEFRCNDCQSKVSLLVRSSSHCVSPKCPQCGGQQLARVMSSFAHHRSEQTRLQETGPSQPFEGPDYYRDPRNIGRWTEHRLKELGMDMRSDEYRNTFSEVREMIDAAREGEMPELVKDL